MRYLFCVLFVLFCGFAFAQTAPVAPASETPVTTTPVVIPGVSMTDAEAGTVIGQLLDAANNGHWTVFGGLIVLILIWGMNRAGLAAKIGPTYVPWFSLGTGALVAIALGLVQGAPILDSLKLGLLEGGIAIALWELVAKHFLSSKPAAPVSQPPSTPPPTPPPTPPSTPSV